jgi:hypothetical protein
MQLTRSTTVHHEARLSLGLSNDEYCFLDTVFKLQSNPKSQNPGWCFAKKKNLAEFLGMTERGIYKMVDRLEKLKLIEKHPTKPHLKASLKWYETVVVQSKNPELSSTQTLNLVQNNPEQSSKHIIGITKGNDKDVLDKETPTPKGERGKAASIFDSLDQFYNQFDNPVAAELLFGQWCAYRLNVRKKKYNSERGARHGIRNLLKLSGGNVEQAHKLAAFAMDKEWIDFYPIPEPPKAKPTPNGYGKLPDDYNPYAHHNVIR